MRASRLIGLALLAGAFAAVLTGVPVGAAVSHAAASKRAGTIAFIRAAPGTGYQGELFSVRADGSGLRRLTPADTAVRSYAWSPDGRFIAYIEERTFALWLVRPDGTGRRLLLQASMLSSLGLSWSPDGKAIAIVSPSPSVNPGSAACAKLALYIIRIGGGAPVRVSSPRRGIGCGVAWSPRGDEIAYGDGGEVLGVISRNGGRPRLLLSSGVGAPQWSPDGTKLAAPTVIHRQLRTDRYRRITVVNADGSDPHVVTDHAYTEYPFAWSPDSRQILYGRQDRQGIYVIGADGRGNHLVTRDSPRQTLWGALAWSPDGGSIVYATDRTGTHDLYVIDANGQNKVRLTSSAATEIDPSWQPHH